MKKIVFASIFLSLNCFADEIICSGITNSLNSTVMPFELRIKGQKSPYFPEQMTYSSTIGYKTPNGANLLQGIDLDSKVRRRLDKVTFEGSSSQNYLKISFTGNSIESAIFNYPFAGFKEMIVTCNHTGSLPERPVCSTDPDKTKSLVTAIRTNKDIDTIETTIDCGANINLVDKNGCTPIMLAVDPDCGSIYQHNVFYNSQRPAIVDLLISNGAYADLADKFGETALIKAAKNKIPNIFESFYAADVDFNAQDLEGNTALMYASHTNDPFYIEDLLIGNPDRTIKNKLGQTAYDYAKHWGNDKVLDLLRAPETTLTIKGDSSGICSPLNLKIRQNELVEIVLEAQSAMMKLVIPEINTEIVANSMSSSKKVVSFLSKGIFEFSCGPHHGGNQSKGTITIK